jgi:hypothetical protein
MPRDIRTAIFKVDLFEPTNNSGYSIDTFYHYSDELTEYPPDVLEQELGTLLTEGHLRQENGKTYYWATKEGKVARQKYFAQIGILSKPLENQQSHALGDLILAVLASNRVAPFSGSNHIPLDALSIYLHEFSDEAIKCAKVELEDAGFIGEDDFLHGRSLYLTGRGLQKYKTDSRFRLDLGGTEGILCLIEAVEKDARFSRLGFDPDLQENLGYRWSEMEACAIGEAYLAAVIMLGSILEGALLAKLRENFQAAMTSSKAPKNKTGTVKFLDDWTLMEYIMVATDLNYAPKSVEKYSHELRDIRNLVHPLKQVNEQIIVDESLYRISREVAETVINALSA